jgi:hypothetical protein
MRLARNVANIKEKRNGYRVSVVRLPFSPEKFVFSPAV